MKYIIEYFQICNRICKKIQSNIILLNIQLTHIWIIIIALYNLLHQHIDHHHIVNLPHYHNLLFQILSYHILLLLLLLNSLSYDYFVISIFVSIIFIRCPSAAIFILTTIYWRKYAFLYALVWFQGAYWHYLL